MKRRIGFLVFALFLVVLGPSRAFARSLASPRTDITATVSADGSLLVEECRTFDYSGSYNGIYFDIDVSDGVDCDVQSVSVGMGDDVRQFAQADSGEPGTYQIQDMGAALRIKIFSPASDTENQVTVAYRLSDLVKVHDDVAELYWMFVSPGWEMASDDVTCRILLPIEYPFTLGDEVRAWGHGSLLGSLEGKTEGNVTAIVYSVPEVFSGDFAEARVTFPSSWMSVAPDGTEALSDIMEEEANWSEEANAKRREARERVRADGASAGFLPNTFAGWLPVAGAVVVSGLAVMAPIWTKRAYRKAHRAQFQEKYWREAPFVGHPAVVGMLLDGDKLIDDEDGSQLSASIVRLMDEGVIAVDSPDTKVLRRGKVESEDPIDRATEELIFARLGSPEDKVWQDEVDTDWMVKRVKRNPLGFYGPMTTWHRSVEEEAKARGFLEDERKFSPSGFWAVLPFIYLFLMILTSLESGPDGSFFLVFAVCLAGVLLGARGQKTVYPPRSPEAVEVMAKAEALARWLKDFTRLEDAPPTDVVLWNELMVYAVVLGVADEALEGLRMRCPDIYSDEAFFFGGDPAIRRRWESVGVANVGRTSFASARSYQTLLAASSDSSSSGSGGGFSGGGGGGHGSSGGGGGF